MTSISVICFSMLFHYRVSCKSWAKSTHVLWERKEGFWFNLGGLWTAASLSLDPRGQWQGRSWLQHGTVLGTQRVLYYSKPRGSSLICLLWVRIMTRLINQEFISILKEAADGTKPIKYITFRGVKQLCDHQRYIFSRLTVTVCVCVYFLF